MSTTASPITASSSSGLTCSSSASPASPQQQQQQQSNEGAVPPPMTPYYCPFPLTGEVTQHAGTSYKIASKHDCYQFRGLADDTEGFTLRYDKNGVIVWDKKMKGESMNLIKTFSTFHVSPEIMWDMLQDSIYRCVWDEARLDAFRIARLTECNDIGYYAGKAPSAISNRDFVNQRAWHNAGDGEYVIFNTSVLHSSCPDNKNCVRAVSKISGYLIRRWGEEGCSLTYLTMSDPKGWIPHMVMNSITSKFAPNMMDKLRKASTEFPSWLEKQTGYVKDWDVMADAWDNMIEDKTHNYVLKRMEEGVGASPIVPPSPMMMSPTATATATTEK